MDRVVKSIVVVTMFAVLGAAASASAGTIYNNEAVFLSAAGTLDFESFEGLAASNTAAAGFSRSLSAFTISGSPNAGVFDLVNYLGTHATDGTKYVEVEGGTQQTLTFTFASAITAFGVMTTDYGDFTANSMTFTTNGGGAGNAVVGARPDGTDQFFGFIDTANPFTTLTLTTASGQFGDPFSVDRVRYSPTTSTTPVPEPASLFLLGTGLATVVRRRIRG